MASGFDASAFTTGLLGNINARNAANEKVAREEKLHGDEEQYNNFSAAAKEYDAAKTKANEESDQIDGMAKTIASHFGRDPALSDYATARDAINNKYTGIEHLPYVYDAADRTYKDMQKNPDKWSVSPAQPQSFTDDSNPVQSQILNQFGDHSDLQHREEVRHGAPVKPYSTLPGSNFGDPENIQNRDLFNKTKTEEDAKAVTAGGEIGWPGEPSTTPAKGPTMLGNAPSPQAPQQQDAGPTNSALPTQGANQAAPNPLAVPAEQLAPPGQGPQASAPQPPMPQQPQQPANSAQPGAATAPSSGIQLNGPNPNASTGGTALDELAGTPASNGNPAQSISRGEQLTGVKLNWEYLHTLPPSVQGNVQGIAQGTVNLTDVVPRSMGKDASALRQKYLDAVHQFDPTWDETVYKSRQAAMTAVNNPNGKVGQSMLSVNRLANHIDALDKSIDGLPNLHASGSGVPLSQQGPPLLTNLENRVQRMEAGGSGTGAYSTFETNKKAVVDEMTRLWRGTGGNAADIAERSKELDSANTPEELHKTLDAMVNLIRGQIDPLQDARDKAMGPHTQDIMSPKARAVFERMAAKAQPGYKDGSTPTGNLTTTNNGTTDYSSLWRQPSGQQQQQ